jgi:predicted enzyme related to lactoylglutathione lyase
MFDLMWRIIMGRVTHFEITADDPERAGKFYSETFDWQTKKWQGPMAYWLVTTGKDETGIDGAIMPRAHDQAVINTIDVDDLDIMMEKVKAAGGQILGAADEIPGVGRFVYASDTEGNAFGMMQADPNAKM